MVYGASNHPVLIKKIKLKVWKLRDELEAVIKARLLSHKDEENPPSIEDLIKEYSPKELIREQSAEEATKEGLSIVEEGEEDAEKKADSEDTTEEGSESSEAEQDSEQEADLAKEMVEGQSEEEVKETATVYRRRPKLEETKVYSGEAILSEIDMQFLNFFSNYRFLSGQSIVIEFLIPKRFVMNADVAFCRSFNMHSRIISEERHPYRIAARFTFLRPGERTLLRNFVSSIEPEIRPDPAPALKKAASDSSNSDDDLDDLDDFDL